MTENGCATEDYLTQDGDCNDFERVAYLHGHLDAAALAIEDGVNLAGYFHWSLMDNFELGVGLSAPLRAVLRRFRDPAPAAQAQRQVLCGDHTLRGPAPARLGAERAGLRPAVDTLGGTDGPRLRARARRTSACVGAGLGVRTSSLRRGSAAVAGGGARGSPGARWRAAEHRLRRRAGGGHDDDHRHACAERPQDPCRLPWTVARVSRCPPAASAALLTAAARTSG